MRVKSRYFEMFTVSHAPFLKLWRELCQNEEVNPERCWEVKGTPELPKGAHKDSRVPGDSRTGAQHQGPGNFLQVEETEKFP